MSFRFNVVVLVVRCFMFMVVCWLGAGLLLNLCCLRLIAICCFMVCVWEWWLVFIWLLCWVVVVKFGLVC